MKNYYKGMTKEEIEYSDRRQREVFGFCHSDIFPKAKRTRKVSFFKKILKLIK